MSPLERLLRPVIGMLNRQIRAKTPAREICRELDGQVVAIRVRDTAMAMYLQIGPEELELVPTIDDPDLVITGSLFAFAAMAAGSGEDQVRSGAIELAGSAETAQRFHRLMGYAKPDLEEQLSGLVGDVAAHGIGDIARNVGRWSKGARETVQQNITEYLQEESRAAPSRYEVDHFSRQVDTLRDDVDRLAAKITLLERSER